MRSVARRSVVAAAALLLSWLITACPSTTPAPIVQKSAVPEAAATRATSVPAPRPGSERIPPTHRVVSGDTLHAIAFRYGLDHRDLIKWNHLANPNLIFVGQTLRLQPPALQHAGKAHAPMRAVPQPRAPASEPRTAKPVSAPGAAGAIRWVWPAQGKTTTAVSLSGAKGLEIRGITGQSVNAAADGTVVYSGSGLRGYGELIIIKHNDTFLSAYAHNESRLVQEGSRVDAGETIARMGNTDTSDVMLHFEIRRNGKAVDPLHYLPSR